MRKGFTLLEMIVVIMIIALLMLITIPNIQRVVKIVQDKGCDSQIKLVDAAILQYMVEFDQIPSVDDLIDAKLLEENQRLCQNNKEIIISDGEAGV